MLSPHSLCVSFIYLYGYEQEIFMFACMNVEETFNTCYMYICLWQGYHTCTSSKTWNQSPKLVIISHLGYIYIYISQMKYIWNANSNFWNKFALMQQSLVDKFPYKSIN